MRWTRSTRGARSACAAALLWLPAACHAALSIDDARQLALDQAPALLAQRQSLAGALVAQPAATTLPDPRLALGVENLNLAGADRYSLARDAMTMQRIGLMQEVPNRAKREARGLAAQARVERERALLAAVTLAVQREASLAWMSVYFAEKRLVLLARLDADNRMLQDTLGARIAAGKALPAELTMARQDALILADRRDDAQRDIAKARAALRRWVGARADDALQGEPPAPPVQPQALMADVDRHAEIAPYDAQLALARADAREADAEQRGDWAWEVAYSRRGPQYGDMVSFQISVDLPWQKERRQQPQAQARHVEAERIEAEREDALRRHHEEVEGQLAELQALDAQRERLARLGQGLAGDRVTLALSAYESGRGDLGAVLAARREQTETALRLIDLDVARAALRVRLTTQTAEAP